MLTNKQDGEQNQPIRAHVGERPNDTLLGCVDCVDERGVQGWLLDIATPHETAGEIALYLGDAWVGKAIPTHPRHDICGVLGLNAHETAPSGFCIAWEAAKVREVLRERPVGEIARLQVIHSKTERAIASLREVSVGEIGRYLEVLSVDIETAPEPVDELDSEKFPVAALEKTTIVTGFVEWVLSRPQGTVICGWIDDRDLEASSRFLSLECRGTTHAISLHDDETPHRVWRVFRPDVPLGEASPGETRFKAGFLVLTDLSLRGGQVVHMELGLNAGISQRLCVEKLDQERATIELSFTYANAQLREIAQQMGDLGLLRWLDQREDFDTESTQQMVSIDQAFEFLDRALIIHGWVASPSQDIRQVELLVGHQTPRSVTTQLIRTHRPDLSFPHLQSDLLGFVLCLEDPEVLGYSAHRLQFLFADGEEIKLEVKPTVARWAEMMALMRSSPNTVLALMTRNSGASDLFLPDRREWLHRQHLLIRTQTAPSFLAFREDLQIAVDRLFYVDPHSVLLFGWWFDLEQQIDRVMFHDLSGRSWEGTGQFSALPRLDVSQVFRQKYAGIGDFWGFACHVPLAKPCVMELYLRSGITLWVKVPDLVQERDALKQVKQVLAMVPSPNAMHSALYSLFDRTLGPAIDRIAARRKIGMADMPLHERTFGTRPADPQVTVIVPLYGRYDFLRHQLAHFVDDPDFDDIDLIYVIDDPTIIQPTQELAVCYHALLGKPFRLAWYDKNLGFAGANNVGASLARGEFLVLLNSDVLPQRSGWVSTLATTLTTLPTAGAVGPLLQFYDGGVQHAGMAPQRDPLLPGFLLNVHPGKGHAWTGSETPSRHPLLTAACLMLRKTDYDAVGGFDEGYLIGDFEDSDLCLQLAKRGKSLWLVPQAKLWHLERQSQTLGDINSHRQLITLYNGWRYHQKIIAGEIANPEAQGA